MMELTVAGSSSFLFTKRLKLGSSLPCPPLSRVSFFQLKEGGPWSRPGNRAASSKMERRTDSVPYTEYSEILKDLKRFQDEYDRAAADPTRRKFELLSSELRWEDGNLDIVRWEGDRMIRIWKPSGWRFEGEPKGYPVLYLNDGQNVFDDNLSFSGCSWKAAGTASKLIRDGVIPPFVTVAVDHAGPLRSWEYTPYQPGTGPMGTLKDAAKWPGCGVNQYLERLKNEIIPWATQTYSLSSDPNRMAFGGSSFGGICTLVCAMRYPHLFSSILVESPSLWLANEKFLRDDLSSYRGPWPKRTFLAMGSEEYTLSRPHDPQPDFDKLLTTYIPKLVEILAENGVQAPHRVMSEVEKGAGHTESAWARRLPQALVFMLSPWKKTEQP